MDNAPQQPTHNDLHDEIEELFMSFIEAYPGATRVIDDMLDHLEGQDLTDAATDKIVEFFRFCRMHPCLALFMAGLAHLRLETRDVSSTRG